MNDLLIAMAVMMISNVPVAHLIARVSSQTWKDEFTGLWTTECICALLFLSAAAIVFSTTSAPIAIAGLIFGAFFYMLFM